MEKSDFYPVLLRSDPPTLLTREQVEDYFKKRGTKVRVMHIPATDPREEYGAQSGPNGF